MTRPSRVSPAARRAAAQRRVAAQRAAIGAAWDGFEYESAVVEGRAHRAIAWVRRISAVAAVVGAGMTARRLLRKGMAKRVFGAIALAQMARRLLGAIPR
jgi:hypothetical protein